MIHKIWTRPSILTVKFFNKKVWQQRILIFNQKTKLNQNIPSLKLLRWLVWPGGPWCVCSLSQNRLMASVTRRPLVHHHIVSLWPHPPSPFPHAKSPSLVSIYDQAPCPCTLFFFSLRCRCIICGCPPSSALFFFFIRPCPTSPLSSHQILTTWIRMPNLTTHPSI